MGILHYYYILNIVDL